MERRTLKMQDIKVRTRDGARYLEGYFAVFDKEYKVWDDWTETIAPGAFTNTLASGRDVKALWNHNHDIVLGSTAARTAKLWEDDKGLLGSILINEKDQDALNAHARVERGDVDGCSFGFNIIRMEESWVDGQYRTRILEVELFEISPCTFPAYEDTNITARAKDTVENARERFEAEKQKQWRAKAMARLKGDNHGT